MGLIDMLLVGNYGAYSSIESAKQHTRIVARRLKRKESKDRKQDEQIDNLERENLVLKYTISALIKILHEKEILNDRDLVDLSEIEKSIENSDGEFSHDEIWSKRFGD